MTFTLNRRSNSLLSDISDSVYPRSEQAHITLFTNWLQKPHSVSYQQRACTGSLALAILVS